MKISDLEKLKEAPMGDPIMQAQDALQKAKDGVVAVQWVLLTPLAAQQQSNEFQRNHTRYKRTNFFRGKEVIGKNEYSM